jgi:5,10-methylenetetrahydromethanopterin reductase
MVTASAIATLVSLVGENRVVVGIGTGFTGRRAMGQKPLRWQDMPRMVGDIRRLLAGDTVEIDGAAARMLHWPGQAPNRPIEVPFVLGVNGPKGLETAAAMRCGVITSRPRPDAAYDSSLDVILLGFGTILEQDETLTSPRVINTAGPGAMVSYHAFLEQHDARLDGFPNAKRFIELANAVAASQRHLALHSGHLTELNAIDRQVITGEALSIAPLVCRPAELPERLAALARQGITEVAFQPMGDVARELSAFAHAAGLD